MKSERGLGEARFGLVGRSLGHSWSPQIHARLGSAPYALVEVEPDGLAPLVRDGAWRGLNVTIPYKREAAALADVRSLAQRTLDFHRASLSAVGRVADGEEYRAALLSGAK